MWVGITAIEQPEAQRLRGTDRERPENNPLTYYERVSVITQALIEAGVLQSEFGVFPFPIESPESLPNFLPTSIPCLTTICEQWNREKIRLLERIGYKVVVLYERKVKKITGSRIRDEICLGIEGWRTLVPAATVRAVEAFCLAERLRKLKDHAG